MSLNDNSSFNWTSTTTERINSIGTIPHHQQVLIDAFNTYIQIGIGSLLFIFGVTFNCLSLLYFCVSRSFRHTTFRLYFSIIAILDTIRLFEFLVFLLFDKGYLKVTLTLCRSVFFTIMFTGQASIWLTVALAVEKCVIIWFPLKGRYCFTMTISKFVLIFVLCLVLFADIIYLLPSFFSHTYENISIHTFMCVWHGGSESSRNRYDRWKKHYLTFNTVFFHSIIPSIILLIVNWLILYSLSRSRSILSKIGSIDAKNVMKREKQFKEKTIQLVLSSFFVIVTISPRYVLTMVNAFATNISKTPLMPLYIYVNLNTVFRVLEMCNYSLNIIFAILSGRTSRLEIRKILWECLFWRFKRTQSDRNEAKYPAHAFLFNDDDDDTDRSVQLQGTTYSALTVQLSSRHNNLSPKLSNGNYSLELSQTSAGTSIFTCCGYSIDLSPKTSHTSYTKSGFEESSSRRSIVNKNPNPLLAKTASYPQSSPSSLNDRLLRTQKSVCYRTDNTPRQITKRRATTLVNCSRNRPSSTNTTIVPPIPISLSNEKLPPSAPIIDIPSASNDECKPIINLTEPPMIMQTDYIEPLLPAYIIETC
ncbi:unnamed protein product [Adineta steineri]|uniref:G-protein coupled receptors family 1 profile domain-containing protein n=1 Tax=Adineta steineri TaxID=433720 RepID=A0A819NB16_9BILA|nr:unnamed protein product [Adineta steineri]CAF3994179.1 unnamed protein product [Adineta steineri]